jgi:hypothetical protein
MHVTPAARNRAHKVRQIILSRGFSPSRRSFTRPRYIRAICHGAFLWPHGCLESGPALGFPDERRPPIAKGRSTMANTEDDRREFLKTCGRFAAVTPPVMTALLSTTLTSTAVMASGGSYHPNNGFGNGSSDGVPGNSDKSDTNR